MNENSKVSADDQIKAKIKSLSNILITVSRNPSIDQLASALALTLALDKMGKHATSVFSGNIPKAMNFLEPEKTFESNADSLRDFIISLDKQKADHLRFKVDGDIVKVLITPYKTTISESDLSFSDGEFNVELVIAIGVDKKDDLDAAIAAHGRILHDANVVTINTDLESTSLGSINWRDSAASGFSEMVTGLIQSLDGGDKPMIDEQVANALLTGLVASTDQFRNDKTSPSVMTMAASLMAKGANQQLVASELSSQIIATAQPDVKHSESELSLNHGVQANNSQSIAATRDETNISVAAPPERSVAETVDKMADSATDRFAAAESQEALATAQAELNEIKPINAPSAINASAEAELDSIVASSGASNTINNDLAQTTVSAPTNPYRGTSTYVEEKITNPINGLMQPSEDYVPDPMSVPSLNPSTDAPVPTMISGSATTKPPSPVMSSAGSTLQPDMSVSSTLVSPDDALQAALSAAQTAETAANKVSESQNSVYNDQSTVSNQTISTNMPPLPPANFDLPLPPPPPMPLPTVGSLPPTEQGYNQNLVSEAAVSSDVISQSPDVVMRDDSTNPSDPGQFQIPS